MLHFLRHQKGQAIMEYALILAMIAIAGFAAIQLVGPKYQKQTENVGNTIPANASKLKEALGN